MTTQGICIFTFFTAVSTNAFVHIVFILDRRINKLTGAPGIEPRFQDLESRVLPLNYAPNLSHTLI